MDRDERIRRNILLFRDEFRALSFKYPSMFHERFISPLDVDKDGWLAFAHINRSRTEGWEQWYVAEKEGWLGRFYGNADGWKEYRMLVDNLCHFLSWRHVLSGPVPYWMDVVHSLAELDGTPLLNVNRFVWDWEPDDHICPDTCGVENPDPYLEMWDERSNNDKQFPKHPLQRILSINVYSASVMALEILLSPQTFLVWGYNPADFPTVLSFLHNEQEKVVSHAESVAASITYPESDYVFRKQGDFWILRFCSNKRVEEGQFASLKGLEHFQMLLSSPCKAVACLGMGVSSPIDTGLSVVSEDEAMDWIEDDTYSGFGVDSALREALFGDQTIKYLVERKSELEEQLKSETDPEKKRDLTKDLASVKKDFNKHKRSLSGQSQSEKAFRRVKKAMNDARAKLRKNKMPALADHLDTWVQRVGYGYRYCPTPEVHWTL